MNKTAGPTHENLLLVLKKYESHPDFLGVEIIDVNQRGAVDDAPLHIAVRRGQLDDIELMLANGAQINQHGDMGNTPMHFAALVGNLDVARRLLLSGADLSLKNEFSQTALDVAVSGGHSQVADLLRKRSVKR
jgi:ankyrin repeat protein